MPLAEATLKLPEEDLVVPPFHQLDGDGVLRGGLGFGKADAVFPAVNPVHVGPIRQVTAVRWVGVEFEGGELTLNLVEVLLGQRVEVIFDGGMVLKNDLQSGRGGRGVSRRRRSSRGLLLPGGYGHGASP